MSWFGWVPKLWEGASSALSSSEMLHDAMFRFINGIEGGATTYGTDLVQATGRTATALPYADASVYALSGTEVAAVLANQWNKELFAPEHWEFFMAFITKWGTSAQSTLIDLGTWIAAAMSSSGAAAPMATRHARALRF